MTQNNQELTFMEHPFNNCGIPPFKYVGYAERLYYPCKDASGRPNMFVPPMAGGMCAHCGTCIRNAYIIEDASGKQFDVGCDCIAKLNIEPKVIALALKEKRCVDTRKRHIREHKKITELKDQYDAFKHALAKLPHPNEHFAKQGKTLADYYDYIIMGCGVAGKIKYYAAAIAKAKGG